MCTPLARAAPDLEEDKLRLALFCPLHVDGVLNLILLSAVLSVTKVGAEGGVDGGPGLILSSWG